LEHVKLIVACFGLLVSAAALAVAIGHGPTQARWGNSGVESMYVVAAICLSVSLLAAIPISIVAVRRPDYIGQAALAGTAVRLLLTMGGMVAYQIMAQPNMGAFLFWAVVFYLLFLTIEAAFSVALVRRCYPSSAKGLSA
jgi:hypothetical protein